MEALKKISGHGGNLAQLAARCGCAPSEILDFSANINPLGPPERLRGIISRALSEIVHYPDPDSTQLSATLATAYGVRAAQVVVGNGTSELLFALPKVIPARRAVIPMPCYIDYERACQRAGLPVQPLLLAEQADFRLDLATLAAHLRPGDLVILGQPNNPTGCPVERAQLLALCQQQPAVSFLIDEALPAS